MTDDRSGLKTSSSQSKQPSKTPIDTELIDNSNLGLHNDSQVTSVLNEKTSPSFQPMRIYTRLQLLYLSESPLVQVPSDMPELKAWFGVENEQTVSKKDTEPSTPSGTRERRFRRDLEDGEATARPSFRSTLSQPSQMGNFKHQSLRASERDRERDREGDRDRDREREAREKDGHERLRHLADKYDRERLAAPSSSVRGKDREAAPHAGSTSARVVSQPPLPTAVPRRVDPREATKKKAGEASEDWRRGAEPPRSNREERTENGRKDRDDRERARSRPRDSSRHRREPSMSRRDRDRDRDEGKDRDKIPRGDRERDDHRRDRDLDKEGDLDDTRHWRDDGKRDERMAARRELRDRERTRDKNANELGWDGSSERRWVPNEDRDSRYKRSTTRDKKSGGLDDFRDRDERKDKERDKEREPAWMDSYVPSEATTGILGGKSGNELDGIQAWKKSLKEKELKEKPSSVKLPATDLDASSLPILESGDKPLDEIQLFKLMMKREEEKKKTDSNDLTTSIDPIARRGSSGPDHATSTLASNDMNGKIPPNAPEIHARPDSAQNSPAILSPQLSSDVPRANNTPHSLLSLLGSKESTSNAGFANLTLNRSNTPNKTKSVQDGLSQAIDRNSLETHLPASGSRVLAFSRAPAKSLASIQPNINQMPTAGLQTMSGDPSLQPSKSEISRSFVGFAPFEEQRQSHILEEQNISPTSGDGHNRRTSADRSPFSQLSAVGQLDSSFDANGIGFAAPKGSRFAKFFDGKREGTMPAVKTPTPIGFQSSSPNPNARQEQVFNGLHGNSTDPRTMDDIFAMLNNSFAQRGNTLNQQSSSPLSTSIPYNQTVNMHLHHQQHPQQQQQPHANSRLEPLYDSRLDDRNFVPDGMVPGLRQHLPQRNRDNPGMFHDSVDDSMHFNMQRLAPLQRGPEPLYHGSLPQNFSSQHTGRNVGLPPPQVQYRGGPSPNNAQAALSIQQQRLPPGLANLGGRPSHEPTQFMNMPGLPGLHGNVPPQQQQAPFNVMNAPNSLGFGGPQVRGPMPAHPLQNSSGLHGMNGPRALSGGFPPQQGPGGQLQAPLLGIRQQQQPQQHMLPQQMMPHMMPPPHLQQPGLPGPSNQQAHDLMALLMGGSHRE